MTATHSPSVDFTPAQVQVFADGTESLDLTELRLALAKLARELLGHRTNQATVLDLHAPSRAGKCLECLHPFPCRTARTLGAVT